MEAGLVRREDRRVRLGAAAGTEAESAAEREELFGPVFVCMSVYECVFVC
jgi:hypothetical protein